MSYTVKQLSELTGLTPRTLRYYDAIGLLRPARDGANDYRRYGPAEVERLRRERWDWYDVLMLYYVGRMTDGEISREKGIRRSLAAQWRKRAQDWLREMYKEEETEGEQYQ